MRRRCRILLMLMSGFALLCGRCLPATPYDYYADVATTNGVVLKASLNEIVSTGSIQIGYANTWEPLRIIDESSTSSMDVQLVYGADTRSKTAGADMDSNPVTGGWSREHSFPQSFYEQDEPMRSDIHALFPADADINNRRSNSPYNYVPEPTYTDVLGNRATTSVFEPADVDKGRVARAILYMDVRYEGYDDEPDLTVVNGPPGGTGYGEMAYLDTLLEWHRLHPPSAFEKARNHKAYAYQRNANPFVDHPEWVAPIWGGVNWAMADGDELIIADSSPPGGLVAAGSRQIPVLVLPTETLGQEVHLGAVHVSKSGTILNEHIGNVQLWYDVDANGSVTALDSLLAESALEDSSATLVLEDPLALYAGFNQLLVTADVSYSAVTSDTMQLHLAPGGVILSTAGGNDVAPTFGIINSGQYTIQNPLDVAGQLLFTEVFEGTQGNLKYVEFHNPTSSTVSFADAGLQLRRYMNGSGSPQVVNVGNVIIPAGGFSVLANNASDFQATFGFAPYGANSNIAHNGNDCYDLFHVDSGLVVDSFAGDRVTLSADFCADRVAYRDITALPNDGGWGTGPIPGDNQQSPSGFWRVRLITAANGNAALVGTPGSLDETQSTVEDWANYDAGGWD